MRTTVHGFVNDLLETPDNITLCGANNNGMFSNGFNDFYISRLFVIRYTLTTPSKHISYFVFLSTTHGFISNSAILHPLNYYSIIFYTLSIISYIYSTLSIYLSIPRTYPNK